MYKKWNKDLILDELKSLLNKLGHIPSIPQLSQSNSRLKDAIHRYGGIKHFLEILGNPPRSPRPKMIAKKREPTWNKETVINEIKQIATELGHFPTSLELRSMGKNTLDNRLGTIGCNVVRRELGYGDWRRPIGYWYIWENLEHEITQNFGDLLAKNIFPSSTLIVKTLHCQPSVDYFGGTAKVAQRMGFTCRGMLITEDGHHVRSSYEYMLTA